MSLAPAEGPNFRKDAKNRKIQNPLERRLDAGM